MLIEVPLNDIRDVAEFLNRQTQTVTHAGLTQDQTETLMDLMTVRGGFRLVPVGEALSFADVWDGVALMAHMTRLVTFRT